MKLTSLSILILLLTPPLAFAIDLNDMLLHKAQKFEPFWGNHYKNIKWIEHQPLTTKEDAEEGYSGQINEIGTGSFYFDKDKFGNY